MTHSQPGFLPVTAQEMARRGWDRPDFVYVTGDAYVDHPSFGHAIISRVLENAGYRVCMLPLPLFRDDTDFMRFGRPKLGFLVTAGVIDSMVNHYTAAKKRRSEDAYAPGGRANLRPDRATIVYCNRIRQAYGDIPIGIGGVEASLRRFAHYDYWDDRVRNSILIDSSADVLMYGMGENTVLSVAEWMKSGKPFAQSRIPGTCVVMSAPPEDAVIVESMEDTQKDKRAYARAFMTQYRNQDPVSGSVLAQKHAARYVVQQKPAMPLTSRELDGVYALPYTRTYHPMYEKDGGVPALQEVEFSIASSRGCFGACNFCALTFHQGRIVTSRGKDSIMAEGKLLASKPGFKGYIHDVGGPTANFRRPACEKQLTKGACENRQCLFPKPCPNLQVDHSEYLDILRGLRALPGIKKVFIRSGIRYDYLLMDKKQDFLNELVRFHVSGQLKVAPEHASPGVLRFMGKPEIGVFDEFMRKYAQANKKFGMEQYLVPYFMSSHPGSTLKDAVLLAEYMKKNRLRPEQVQDFYPTPGTLSTAMFYTELDVRDMTPIYVAKSPRDKAMQRALMQFDRPQNRALVIEALRRAGRTDLIGNRPECLIHDASSGGPRRAAEPSNRVDAQKNRKKTERRDTRGENRPPKHGGNPRKAEKPGKKRP